MNNSIDGRIIDSRTDKSINPNMLDDRYIDECPEGDFAATCATIRRNPPLDAPTQALVAVVDAVLIAAGAKCGNLDIIEYEGYLLRGIMLRGKWLHPFVERGEQKMKFIFDGQNFHCQIDSNGYWSGENYAWSCSLEEAPVRVLREVAHSISIRGVENAKLYASTAAKEGTSFQQTDLEALFDQLCSAASQNSSGTSLQTTGHPPSPQE